MNREETQINRTMDRADLLTAEGSKFVAELSSLAEELDAKKLPVTSWYGALTRPGFELSMKWIRYIAQRFSSRADRVGPTAWINRGGESYEPVPAIRCDDHHPWFLYWEAYWVMKHGPTLRAENRILDAGGAASLFSYYLATQGAEVCSVNENEKLIKAANTTSRAMEWNLRSYCMEITDLEFDDAYFDGAYSIGALERLDAHSRQRALLEIARVLKPGGVLAITFDYGAPGVFLSDKGHNYDSQNLIRTPDDVTRHFVSTPYFEPMSNCNFEDNGKTYLAWPFDPEEKYTFGALFLRRKDEQTT